MRKFVKRITVAVTVLSMSIAQLVPMSVTAEELHPAALQWDDMSTINENLDTSLKLPASVPKSKDLTSIFPTPGNQGKQGSCVAWAVGYALKSSQENTKRGWNRNLDTHKFSPSFIYNQTVDSDHGMTISQAMKLIQENGICSLKYCSYNEKDIATQPTAKALANAKLYKSTWNTIQGIESIKGCIAEEKGVVIGVEVYPDFDNLSQNNQVYDNKSGNSRGGHAICLIGYDDSKKAFKFINSWGTNWGLNGYGWISYDLVNDIQVNHHGIAVGYIMEPTTDDYVLGDINSDGSITSQDALMVLQYNAKLQNLSDRQYALADVNGDTLVDSTDADAILEYAVKRISKLPLYN